MGGWSSGLEGGLREGGLRGFGARDLSRGYHPRFAWMLFIEYIHFWEFYLM